MNLTELKKELEHLKIRKDCYCLEGGLPNEAFCIENINGSWYTYYSERGGKTGRLKHKTENDACLFLLKTVLTY